MTIHPFPSAGPRYGLLPGRLSRPDSAGVVHAEAIPALFSRLQYPDHTQDNLRQCRAVVTEFGGGESQRRDLITRADAILRGCILAEVASENLLRRAEHVLGNSVCDANNFREASWKLLRKPIPEKSATNQGRGQ